MNLWQPSPDEPDLFDWWRPLLAVSRLARAERFHWPVYVEEFDFQGRVERGSRPAIWVYEHRRSGREVLADWQGHTYEFIRYRSGRQRGRFKEIDIRSALWRARLPDVVEPVSYDEPRERRLVQRLDGSWDHEDEPAEEATPSVVRRSHLSLVPPPPNLN
jgi:hypothetical protein